jgi:hypothetical protein
MQLWGRCQELSFWDRLELWPARWSATRRGPPFRIHGGREGPSHNVMSGRPSDPLQQQRKRRNPQHRLQSLPQQRSRRNPLRLRGPRPIILCHLSSPWINESSPPAPKRYRCDRLAANFSRWPQWALAPLWRVTQITGGRSRHFLSGSSAHGSLGFQEVWAVDQTRVAAMRVLTCGSFSIPQRSRSRLSTRSAGKYFCAISRNFSSISASVIGFLKCPR